MSMKVSQAESAAVLLLASKIHRKSWGGSALENDMKVVCENDITIKDNSGGLLMASGMS